MFKNNAATNGLKISYKQQLASWKQTSVQN